MEETINYKELYEKILIENDELKKKLKSYTAPKRSKTFYENHKDEIIQKVKEYKEKTGYKSPRTPEQIKEYNKRAYEKRKLKKLLEN
jgi:phage terminase large subunit